MEHIRTLETRDLAGSVTTGGCGECQTSCQSACKPPGGGPTEGGRTGGERAKRV